MINKILIKIKVLTNIYIYCNKNTKNTHINYVTIFKILDNLSRIFGNKNRIRVWNLNFEFYDIFELKRRPK